MANKTLRNLFSRRDDQNVYTEKILPCIKDLIKLGLLYAGGRVLRNIPEMIGGDGINTPVSSGKRVHSIVMGRRDILKMVNKQIYEQIKAVSDVFISYYPFEKYFFYSPYKLCFPNGEKF